MSSACRTEYSLGWLRHEVTALGPATTEEKVTTARQCSDVLGENIYTADKNI